MWSSSIPDAELNGAYRTASLAEVLRGCCLCRHAQYADVVPEVGEIENLLKHHPAEICIMIDDAEQYKGLTLCLQDLFAGQPEKKTPLKVIIFSNICVELEELMQITHSQIEVRMTSGRTGIDIYQARLC